MLHISVADEQTRLTFDAVRLREAVRGVLTGEKIRDAEISVAVVDDQKMHELNLKYLQHDYATDVLSFPLNDDEDGPLEGEVIVSIDTAEREAAEYGWKTEDELLLYAVHGVLHLVGYDDQDLKDRIAMREAEARYLARYGLTPRHEDPLADPHAESSKRPNA
jgi:probable rRNA maturation factor